MTPSARLQAVIEIVEALQATSQPADRFLRDWFGARRYAGSKDRAAISERVYAVLRRRQSFAWRMQADTGRAWAVASLLAEGKSPGEVEDLFDGSAYGPPRLAENERARLAADPGPPPRHVEGEYPLWLENDLVRAYGAELMDEMRALQMRACVDLRVNRLRASRDDMLVGLRSLGLAAAPGPYSPDGIRIASAQGLGALSNTQFFQTGAFEFQDEASQLAALLCDAKAGQNILDLAAGAGGKSLALAAIMKNRGQILAFDDDPQRLRPLRARARRAGATIIMPVEKRGGPLWGDGMFDLVLVDAPCSGTGTWRRQPELRWRLTPQRLEELQKTQSGLLDEGARHAKPGGRLVYATCSLLPSENEDQIAAFLARQPEFRVIPAKTVWRGPDVPGLDVYLRASPLKTGTDGFFVAIMERTSIGKDR